MEETRVRTLSESVSFSLPKCVFRNQSISVRQQSQSVFK